MKVDDLVVPVDFSHCSEAACARASALAGPLDSRLHLVHAVAPVPYPPEFGYPRELLADVEAHARDHLSRWAGKLREAGHEVTETCVVGSSVDAIQERAAEVAAGLIVMGTHGRTGLRHTFLGSVAARTLRIAPCPVWTVREEVEEAAAPVRRVLLPTDFSPKADHALDLAIDLCTELKAELNVVHVFHNPLPGYAEIPQRPELLQEFREAAQRELEAVGDRVRKAGLDGARALLEGSCAKAIAQSAKTHGIDLIVLGTEGRRGVSRALLGSVAEGVLRRAPCSVLTTTRIGDGE